MIKIEFMYNQPNNVTEIFVWSGEVLLDHLTMSGILSQYQRKKIRDELKTREEKDQE